VLRRDYPLHIMCPNSGPDHSPLFKVGDLDPNSNFMVNLTNSPTDLISTFLWTNFTAAGQFNLTNSSAVYAVQQTNLVVEMNRIITSMVFYTNGLFASYTNIAPIPSLITNTASSQVAVEINRYLLLDALNVQANFSADNSGTADILFSVQPPQELRVKKNRPAPSYTLVMNGDSSSGGLLHLLNPGTGYSSTNDGTVKILKDKFGHYGLGDGCDDAARAPGQGNWLTMGPGCTEDTNRIALKWSVSLGRSFDGLAAGQLALAESGLTRDTYTPFALYYNGSMTNLYATETLFATNLPAYVTNSDNTITTNRFIPIQSQNLWAQVAISTNATAIPGTNIVFCTTYTTNADSSVTTNQIVTVDSDPVWTQIVSAAPTNTTAQLFTNIVVYTNCLVPVVLVQSLAPYTLTNSAGELYTNVDTPLRQVKAYQTFVDILTPDTNQTVLNFYHASDVGKKRDFTGLYTNFNAGPFVTYTIQNPEPATANKLNIIETRNGISSTQSLVKAASPSGVTWTLTLGTGAEQRIETRQVSFSGGNIPTDRVEMDSIAYASTPNSTAYQCQETYHCYQWGWELKETKVPNSPADLVTTYNYYDDQNEPYGYYGYGQIKDITYPDGYWEKRVYEDLGDGYRTWGGSTYPGMLDYVFSPRMDGMESGVASPDDAPSFYTTSTKFVYYPWGSDNGRGALEAEHLADHAVNIHYNEIWQGVSGSAEGDLKYSQNQKIYGHDHRFYYWNYLYSYADSAPVGLAGHTYMSTDAESGYKPDRDYYYDHGVFDPLSSAFLLDTNNHIYTAEATLNYPDNRETVLYCQGMDLNSEYYNSKQNSYDTIEGHQSGLYFSSGVLIPSVTHKATSIYHMGNLLQTESYLYLGQAERWSLLYKLRYYLDSLGRATNVVRIDGLTSAVRTVYSADYRGANGCDGILLLSETDEKGATTVYTYDSLQRVKTVTAKAFGGLADQVTQFSYDANGQVLSETLTAGNLTQTQAQSFDLSGRVVCQTNQSGEVTLVGYSNNGRTITTTLPGGLTQVVDKYLDRRTKDIFGSAVIPEYYYYDSQFVGYAGGLWEVGCQEKFTYKGHLNSPRWHGDWTDSYDMDAGGESPIGAGTTNTAWVYKNNYYHGRLYQVQHSAGTPATVYDYDAFGQMLLEQNTLNGMGEVSFDSIVDGEDFYCSGSPTYDENFADNNRGYFNKSLAIQIGNAWYQATTNCTFLSDASNVPTVQSIHLEQLSGFTGSQIAGSIDYDADGNETDTTTTLDRANNKITVTTSKPNTSVLPATTIYQNGQVISASTFSVANPTLYYYDALGRTNGIQDPQGNLSLMTYDPNTGWLTSVTDPAHHTTSYAYYGITEANAGKLKCQTDANGKKTYYAYTTQGQLYHTWGDVPYPAEYRYSEYGDLTNLITFRGGSGWTGSSWPGSSGGDNTYWQYDDASGALLKKIDAQGRYVSYSYSTNTGQLLTRSWGRTVNGVAVTVTNSYNGFGDLVSQEYNDGTPNVYFNNYNRTGQPREIIDGSGTNELVYDNASRLVSTACAGGLLAGVTVSNHFNPYYGRDALKVISTTGAGWMLEDDYGYDNYGRLASVSSGTATASYGYVPNSDLLQSTTFNNNGNAVMTTTRKWNYGFQLASIANTVAGASTPVTSHAYTYDSVNRRTQATLEDNSTWKYGYNDRNELTSANRQWYDTRPVSGQQFGYGYDNIGNRTSAQFGGDTNGNNLQTISYTANNLNQYTGIVTPTCSEICGAALATNTVMVNSGTADRHGEHFHREIATGNGSGAAWQTVTVSSGGVTNNGGLALPAAAQTLAYDADGNLIFDGVWTYQWDGENRLASMWMTNGIAGIASSNVLKLDFTYDYLWRRVQKVASIWNVAANGFVPANTNRFVYDGWNLLAILSPSAEMRSSYVWGQDISGTFILAGGVGGLLIANISGTNCFGGYDGNGNLSVFIKAADRSLAARYEYNPYGQLIRKTGVLASQIPFRYSTKFSDEESDLTFFGKRMYSPFIGRWLNEDPSGIQGGINLYSFVANHSINSIDDDGCAEHHPATMQLANSLPDGPGTDYLKKFTVTVADPHYYTSEHRAYNVAIREFFDNWCSKRGISAEDFAKSSQLAEQFVQDIMAQPNSGKIGGYLSSIGASAAYWGGKAAKAAVILGVAFGGVASAYNAVAGGNDLVQACSEYKRDVEAGKDSAWIDLDAIDAAVDVQTMTGDYFVTMAVMDTLLTQ